jgi:hypothetical protein
MIINTRRPKPHLNEFFVRGIPLAKAIEVLARWEKLTDGELAQLGFSGDQGRAGLDATSRPTYLN